MRYELFSRFLNYIINTLHNKNKINTNPHDKFLQTAFKNIKKFLKNNSQLIVILADEGNTIVIPTFRTSIPANS